MPDFINNKGEHTAVFENWVSSSSVAFMVKAKEVFVGLNKLVFEFWPNSGQLILWEDGYEDKRFPLAVNVVIESWADEYLDILNSSKTDEECEVRAVVFEKKVIDLVKPLVDELLGSEFNINYFITNEEKII